MHLVRSVVNVNVNVLKVERRRLQGVTRQGGGFVVAQSCWVAVFIHSGVCAPSTHAAQPVMASSLAIRLKPVAGTTSSRDFRFAEGAKGLRFNGLKG